MNLDTFLITVGVLGFASVFVLCWSLLRAGAEADQYLEQEGRRR